MAFPTIVQAITGLRLKKKTLMLPRSQVSSAEICDDAGSCCSGSTPMGSGSGSGHDRCTTECFIYGCEDSLVCPPIELCCTIENISATSCGALDGKTFPVTLNFTEAGSPCYIDLGTHTYEDCEISGVLEQVDPSIAGIYYPYLLSSVPTSFWSFDGEYLCGVGRKNFALNNGTTYTVSVQCNPFKLVIQLMDSFSEVILNEFGNRTVTGSNRIQLTIEACSTSTPPVTVDCCPGEVPGTLYLNLTNGCESFGADSPLVYDANGEDGPGWYSETKVVMGETIYFRFGCAGSTMFEIEAFKNGSSNGLGIAEPNSCNPFDWTTTITHSGYACDANSTMTATINE